MPFDPALLLGPGAAAVLLAYAVKRLWDSHDKADADVIAQRNEAIAGWREANATLGRMADAIEATNRDNAERRRLEDTRRVRS
jgi:hypothetical protein